MLQWKCTSKSTQCPSTRPERKPQGPSLNPARLLMSPRLPSSHHCRSLMSTSGPCGVVHRRVATVPLVVCGDIAEAARGGKGLAPYAGPRTMAQDPIAAIRKQSQSSKIMCCTGSYTRAKIPSRTDRRRACVPCISLLGWTVTNKADSLLSACLGWGSGLLACSVRRLRRHVDLSTKYGIGEKCTCGLVLLLLSHCGCWKACCGCASG